MPLPKRPYVAYADQIRITRNGDCAIVEYADETVATTHLKVGAERLSTMTDEDLLGFWNDFVRGTDEFRESVDYVAIEIPVGKPQVEYVAAGDQWTPRGDILRCQVLSDGQREPDEPFVSIDGRDFTLAEFATMVSTFEGWGMRIEFVPDDELHIRPRLRVAEPEPKVR
jgi:hypothetical protein